MLIFICHPGCSTCKKARQYLENNNVEYVLRDITADNPTLEELTCWLKLSGLEIKKLFNTSGLKYRALCLKDKLNGMSEEEALELLASDGMLVKRPVLVGEDFVLFGFKEAEWANKLNI